MKNIPKELKEYNQWLLYKTIETTDKNGKIKVKKLPISAKTLRAKGWNQKENWSSYDYAVERLYTESYDGLSFVLTKSDPFICIDLDNCYNDGRYTVNAKACMKALEGTYMEFSKSGKVLHIFVKGEISEGFNNQNKGVEIYDSNKCIAMTGNALQTPYASMDILYLQDELQGIYDTFKPRKRPSQTFVVDRYINQNVGLDENEVINQLCKFNQRGKDLFYGLTTTGDKSRDDFTLLLILNSFTHSNRQLMKSIFLKSALNRSEDRSKRNNAAAYERYLDKSIEKAIQIGGNNHWEYRRRNRHYELVD
jgi:primase-polymerase (primpol)-like protein